MANNKKVTEYLEGLGYFAPDDIVGDLIEGGFIDADEMTEPERYAHVAHKYLRGDSIYIFETAAGWNTASWETIMKERIGTPANIRNIFAALVILAKEAGVSL